LAVPGARKRAVFCRGGAMAPPPGRLRRCFGGLTPGPWSPRRLRSVPGDSWHRRQGGAAAQSSSRRGDPEFEAGGRSHRCAFGAREAKQRRRLGRGRRPGGGVVRDEAQSAAHVPLVTHATFARSGAVGRREAGADAPSRAAPPFTAGERRARRHRLARSLLCPFDFLSGREQRRK
jgi:hypothetical protein